MTPDTTSNKRKFDEVATVIIENDTQQSKNNITTCSSTLFLSCHLKMLRALYNNDGDDVSEEVWGMIQRFLEQRHELRQMKIQANKWRSIVDESHAYGIQQQQQQQQQSIIASPRMMMMYPPTSPLEKRLFSSPYVPTTTTTPTNNNSKVTNNNAFSLVVSKLLDRRARVSENKARKVVHPFHELYTAVCNRSERLDSLLLEPEPKEDNVQGDNDDKRSSVFEVDAKNRLWKNLANDLYNVIQI